MQTVQATHTMGILIDRKSLWIRSLFTVCAVVGSSCLKFRSNPTFCGLPSPVVVPVEPLRLGNSNGETYPRVLCSRLTSNRVHSSCALD